MADAYLKIAEEHPERFVVVDADGNRSQRTVGVDAVALREREFVQGARGLGASGARIMLRHLLPNTFSSIIVMSTLSILSSLGVNILPLLAGAGVSADNDVLDCSHRSLGDAVKNPFGYPVFVKPARLGSSVGITKAHDEAELDAEPRDK